LIESPLKEKNIYAKHNFFILNEKESIICLPNPATLSPKGLSLRLIPAGERPNVTKFGHRDKFLLKRMDLNARARDQNFVNSSPYRMINTREKIVIDSQPR